MSNLTTLKFNDIETKSSDNDTQTPMVTCLKQTTSTCMPITLSNIMICK